MKLKVLGSSSKGNCYLLEDEREILIIEAGIKYSSLKKSLNFDFSKVVGCLCSHEHMDHAKSAESLANGGVDIYASHGTFNAIGNNNRFKTVKDREPFQVGSFHIMPIKVFHDVAEPLAFIIHHKSFGNLLFVTDTGRFPYNVKNINYAMVEANHSTELLQDDIMYKRINETHLNINQACEITANMPNLYKLMLIHLSSRYADAEKFKEQAIKATGTNVCIAEKGSEVELSIL